jgi:hypothetical protein
LNTRVLLLAESHLTSFRFFIFTFLFFIIYMAPALGQLDYRNAILINSDGDSIRGKVPYYENFANRSDVIFKDANGKRRVSVKEIRQLLFTEYKVYTAVQISPGRTVLLLTLIDGDIALYKTEKRYYLFKDSLYFLNNEKITVARNGKEVTARSKKYLSSLNIAFYDCRTLDYQPLASEISLGPILKLVNNYATCSNRKIRRLDRKSTIEIMPYYGTVNYTLKSGYFQKTLSQSDLGTTIGVGLVKSLTETKRFALRTDINYVEATIKRTYEQTIRENTVPTLERSHFAFNIQGFRIPFGLQYYIKRNDLSIYLAGGMQINLMKVRQFEAEGYYIYKLSGVSVYQPTNKSKFVMNVDLADFWDAWLTIGGDHRLTNRLRINAELKASKSNYNVMLYKEDIFSTDRGTPLKFSLAFLSPTIGIKFRL